MKRKYVLIILSLIIGIMIVSCTGDNAGIIDTTKKDNQIFIDEDTYIDNIKITSLLLHTASINTDELRTYEQFFKDEYNIDLKMEIILGFDSNGANTAKLLRDSPNGIYFFTLSNINQITKLSSTEKILPLEKYLANNITWNELPTGMKEMYSIGDNQVWAIPRGYEQILYARVYRNSFLKEVSMEIPSSLGELYDIAKAVKNKKGVAGIAFYDILSFNDIFYANSTPLAKSHTGIHNTSIVYNPDTNSFEDSMLKEEMTNTLNYIKVLIEEELVENVGEYTNYSTKASSIMIDTEIYFSIYGEVDSNLFDDSKYQIGYDLIGVNQGYTNPISYNYNGGFYVLAAETKNPELTINTFVTLFYGDFKAYFASIYGIPGESYLFEGQGIKVLNENIFTKTQFPIVRENPIILINEVVLESLNEVVSNKVETEIMGINEKQRFIEYGLANEKIVEYSLNIAYPIVYPPMDSIVYIHPCAQLLDDLFHSFSRELISTEDFINEYTEKMKVMGQQKIIDELNDKLGSKTTFSY